MSKESCTSSSTSSCVPNTLSFYMPLAAVFSCLERGGHQGEGTQVVAAGAFRRVACGDGFGEGGEAAEAIDGGQHGDSYNSLSCFTRVANDHLVGSFAKMLV